MIKVHKIKKKLFFKNFAWLIQSVTLLKKLMEKCVIVTPFFDADRPDLVAPVVAWMCHEDCQDNGQIVETAGGWAGKCKENITMLFLRMSK